MAYTNDLDTDIRKVRGLLTVMGLEKRIKIAYDEWNLRGWHHPNVHTVRQGVTEDEYLTPRDKNDLSRYGKFCTGREYTLRTNLRFMQSVFRVCKRKSFGQNHFQKFIRRFGMQISHQLTSGLMVLFIYCQMRCEIQIFRPWGST